MTQTNKANLILQIVELKRQGHKVKAIADFLDITESEVMGTTPLEDNDENATN